MPMFSLKNIGTGYVIGETEKKSYQHKFGGNFYHPVQWYSCFYLGHVWYFLHCFYSHMLESILLSSLLVKTYKYKTRESSTADGEFMNYGL